MFTYVFMILPHFLRFSNEYANKITHISKNRKKDMSKLQFATNFSALG